MPFAVGNGKLPDRLLRKVKICNALLFQSVCFGNKRTTHGLLYHGIQSPVAGKDSMELNLSGAHAPFFTRNIVILHADNGEMGIGEVPGGEKITNALKECVSIVEGTNIAQYKSMLLRLIWIRTAAGFWKKQWNT